jgi:hypothetical protein
MKTFKIFQAALANNLTLAAVSGMGIATITLCCAYCNTENCSPTVTLVPDNNPACENSVGVTVFTTCDDESDIIEVNNPLDPPQTTLPYDQIEEGTVLLWYGNVPLAAGINTLTAYTDSTNGCGLASSEVDVPSNGGSYTARNAYLYTCMGRYGTLDPYFHPLTCGIEFDLSVFCLPASTTYQIYEDPPQYNNGQSCDPGRIYTTLGDNITFKTDVNGTFSFNENGYPDKITYPYPGTQSYNPSCGNIVFTKFWHVYDPVIKGDAFTGDSETVTFAFSSGNTILTVSDSAVPGCSLSYPY